MVAKTIQALKYDAFMLDLATQGSDRKTIRVFLFRGKLKTFTVTQWSSHRTNIQPIYLCARDKGLGPQALV